MKIALVHDYLNEAGGAERVLRVLSDMYPEAPIFTAFVKNGSAKKLFSDRRVIESPWGWFLKIGRFYSYFRFLLPFIWKSVDLRNYDLVVTSCSGYVARGFTTKDSVRVVAYCHTPPKWLYGYETPTDGNNRWWGRVYLRIFGPFMRYFDFVSAQRVTTWIANSQEVAHRIEKFYRKKAVVIYPPVEINPTLDVRSAPLEYYLAVARVTGAKGLIEAARAAQGLKKKLVVVGEVVERKVWQQLEEMGEYVTLVGRVSDEELARYYAQAQGYIALAKDEDFGMTVVESMMSGTPVLAYASGGYKETVVHGKTGILIENRDLTSVKSGLELMDKKKWDRVAIKKWASKFGREQFERDVREVVHARTSRS